MVIIVFISLVYHTSMLMLWAQLNVPCTCYMTSYPSAASCLDPRVQVVMVMAVFRFQWGTLGGVNSRLWPLYATPGCGPSMRLQVVAPLCNSRLWPLYATPGCGPSMRLQVVAPLCNSRLWPLHAVQFCAGSGTTAFTHGRFVRNTGKGTPSHRH